MVRDLFINLYCEETPYSLLSASGGFLFVERNDWDFIFRTLSVDEIKDTLFHPGSLKALGPDRLHALFFQGLCVI